MTHALFVDLDKSEWQCICHAWSIPDTSVAAAVEQHRQHVAEQAPPRTDYTREELIAICEAAIVPQQQWRNRDSYSAQKNVGECWTLLKAGCEFDITTVGNCATDRHTIWLTTQAQGFNYFEHGSEDGRVEEDTHYLPTPERLAARAGKDWY